MNTKRIFIVAALLCVIGLTYSCEKETADDSGELYSIDRKDIKDEDT
jgi:hypothetical protein